MARTWLTAPVAVLVAAVAVLAFARPAAASSTATITTTIDGRAVAGSSGAHPVALHPSRLADVDVHIVNRGGSPIDVRSVELTGKVIGLTFYSFNTSVDLTVPGGSSGDLRFELQLRGIDGQATGLIPASIAINDARGDTIASQGLTTDVRGSISSVYGLFGLAVFVLTALALAAALLALARHRLPDNRFLRGTRFLTPGIGFGLVLVFTVSALRIFVPKLAVWLIILIVCAAVFFLLGYLTPDQDDTEEEDDDEDLDPAPVGSGAVGRGAVGTGGAAPTAVASRSEVEGWPGPPS